MLEVQAALELYYLRCCADKAADSFPRLSVGSALKSPPQASLHVTRAQLYSRLARVGGPADCFDHPLLYARSGMAWRADGPNAIEQNSLEGANEERQALNAFAWPEESLSEEEPYLYPVDLSDPFDQALPATITVAGNLALARCLLALTPITEALSLTGFFECAVVGNDFSSALPLLRILNLGPPPTVWTTWPCYQHPTFSNVEKLRICGGTLIPSEAAAFRNSSGAWPALRELQWSIVEDKEGPELWVLYARQCYHEQLC